MEVYVSVFPYYSAWCMEVQRDMNWAREKKQRPRFFSTSLFRDQIILQGILMERIFETIEETL